jgi:small subunit ribosomal protein S7
MPRRREIPKREILPDPKFESTLCEKFVNVMMVKGKKAVARNILYKSFEIIESRIKNKEVLEIFKTAIENVKPMVEVKSRRVGGATYQVPVEIRQSRREALALRWLIGYARDRSEKSMIEKLASELVEAYNKRGGAMKKREDTHRMAEANKAFAHFRW